jgi:hypothetical protein
MEVDATARKNATLQVPQVTLKHQVEANSPYEFEILPPDDIGTLASDVSFEGTTSVVEQMRLRLGDLQSKIYAVAYLDEAAQAQDAEIRAKARERPEDPEWIELTEVLVAVPSHLLSPFQLKPTQSMYTAARARLRTVGKDSPDNR